MFPLLLVLFVAVPIIELAAILQVGSLIGFWPTLALLIFDSLVGAALLRAQGRTAWRRFNAAIAERRPPATEVIDGVLVIFGGALLLTPGFVTDLAGILLLLPPTRAVARRLLVHRLAGRMVASFTAARAGRRRPPSAGGRFDVDGTASEVGSEPQRLP